MSVRASAGPAAVAQLEREKDEAYLERNNLVALLAAIFPSVQCQTEIPGWEAEWQNCVYLELPTGQVSWHYHDSQEWLFEHVPVGEVEWDGHSTATKYERVREACGLVSLLAEVVR